MNKEDKLWYQFRQKFNELMSFVLAIFAVLFCIIAFCIVTMLIISAIF